MSRNFSVTGGETVSIRRTNPKTFAFIFFVTVFTIWPLTLSLITPLYHFPWFVYLAIGVFLFFGGRVYGLLTKVNIGPDGIEINSPFKKRKYYWKEISIVGMYERRHNRVWKMSPKKFNENFIFGLKYVWFSKYPGTEPAIWQFPNDYYGDFEFRKDAWELFDKYAWANIAGVAKEDTETRKVQDAHRGF